MIKKGKYMITVFDDSLLKRDQFFVLWVQRLIQQTLQFIFQIRSELIRIIIEGGRKLVLKFMCLFEHCPESDRPVHFVTLFKIFGFTLQMSRAKLMASHRSLKMSLPAIKWYVPQSMLWTLFRCKHREIYLTFASAEALREGGLRIFII